MLVQLLRAATECEFDLVPDTDQVMQKGLDLGSRTATKGGTHDAVIMNLTPKCPCERADARPAALPVQSLRAELHGHASTGQGAGPESGCGAALCERPVDEPHRPA